MNVYSVNSNVFQTKSFKRFDRYLTENTVKSYTNVIRKYVKFAKSESLDPFPVNEIKVRRFIDCPCPCFLLLNQV